MRSALIIRDGVNLVDDHGVHAAQVLAALLRGQQNVERLRRGDQNVRRRFEHRPALRYRRVAGADSGADRRAEVPALERELLNFLQRRFEVLLDVVRERFQRRDVDDLRFAAQPAFERFTDEAVDTNEKRREGLAGAGGCGDEHGPAVADDRPAQFLRLSGRTEAAHEPLLHKRVRPSQGVGNREVQWDLRDWGHRGEHPPILLGFSFLLRPGASGLVGFRRSASQPLDRAQQGGAS